MNDNRTVTIQSIDDAKVLRIANTLTLVGYEVRVPLKQNNLNAMYSIILSEPNETIEQRIYHDITVEE